MIKIKRPESHQKQYIREDIPLHSEKDGQKVYTFNKIWKESTVCKPYKTFLHDDDFQLTNFTSKAGSIVIFTHNPDRDFVSREIKSKGAFDVHLINKVIDELNEDRDVNVIDIGTNVGQFCLATALLGRRCIGIDAAESNIQHVCSSTEFHKFGARITLIYNALSNTHEQIDIQLNGKGDFGTIFVDADNVSDLKRKSPAFKGNRGQSVKINTVKVDDILDLPEISHFHKVFIKMDVEGFEHKVLLGAEKFFQKLDVRGIIMEWNWHVGRNSSVIIIDLLSKWGFIPCSINRKVPLELGKSSKWPHDILWYPFSRYPNMLD